MEDTDGLYDFSLMSASQLTERQLEECELHLLTQKSTHAVKEDETNSNSTVNHDADGPLGKLVREREGNIRLWGNCNCRTRFFRPFSERIGKMRALSD